MTWAPHEAADEKAFQTILTFLKGGGKLLNSGEFYGNGPDRIHANLELLARFFEAYPEWAQEGKCFLSVKGGLNLDGGKLNHPDGSLVALRKSVDNINQKLGGKKKMDLFEVCSVLVLVSMTFITDRDFSTPSLVRWLEWTRRYRSRTS